jgi:hypothetical protein
LLQIARHLVGFVVELAEPLPFGLGVALLEESLDAFQVPIAVLGF